MQKFIITLTLGIVFFVLSGIQGSSGISFGALGVLAPLLTIPMFVLAAIYWREAKNKKNKQFETDRG